MTRSLTIACCFILGAALPAFALPPIPKYAAEFYGKEPKAAAITESLKAGKCALCHIPNADKKAKGHGLNDFGKAVHDNFKHKDFTAADKAGEKDKAMEILVDGLKKAAELKNADGKVFGDLIKAGEMPGKNG